MKSEDHASHSDSNLQSDADGRPNQSPIATLDASDSAGDHSASINEIQRRIESGSVTDALVVFDRMQNEARVATLETLPRQSAATLLAQLIADQASKLLVQLDAHHAARILEPMASDLRVKLLSQLDAVVIRRLRLVCENYPWG